LLIVLILLDNFAEAIIRNNRVILHDEHLPNGSEGEEAGDFEEREHPSRRGESAAEEEGEGTLIVGHQRERKRRELPEWRDEWKRKAIQWGQTEDEQARQVPQAAGAKHWANQTIVILKLKQTEFTK
jgi:hypothetical protein